MLCFFVLLCSFTVSIYFFFFQAEDGIRDLTVTGVQTCALPIWLARRPDLVDRAGLLLVQRVLDRRLVWLVVRRERPVHEARRHEQPALAVRPHRSEEHTSELQSQSNLVCRLLLEKKKKQHNILKSI